MYAPSRFLHRPSPIESLGSEQADRLDTCAPCGSRSGNRTDVPSACSPARLVRHECAGRCGRPSTDPPASQGPRRSNSSSPRGEPVCSPARAPTPVVVQRARDSESRRWACRRLGKVSGGGSWCRAYRLSPGNGDSPGRAWRQATNTGRNPYGRQRGARTGVAFPLGVPSRAAALPSSSSS
jgi:hypothetical protein